MESAGSKFLSYFLEFMVEDWFASIPITICLLVMVGVILERAIYYSRNQRNLGVFIRQIQSYLEQGDLDSAVGLSQRTGGLVGLMTEESIRLVQFHAKNFSNAFDISANLYIRDLETRLPYLSTIGTTCPFLGLFGTVIGVIVTLNILGETGGQNAAVVIGVAKALIATGYGLIVAIIAVVMNNCFNSLVTKFENDFQIIKLTFMDYVQSQGLDDPNYQTASYGSMNNMPQNAVRQY